VRQPARNLRRVPHPGPLPTSEVPPQGSYMAKRCPNALQLDVLHPCEPLPTSSFISMLGDEGRDFEAEIFELLAGAVPGAVVIDECLPRSAREAATAAAMDAGVPLVIGGRLPVDRMALRAGEPDLLVRSDAFAPGATADGYLPVDVKHHKTLDRKTKEDEAGAMTSELLTFFSGPVGPDAEMKARWRWPDLLQLAHYQRLLEASGRASRLSRWAGIVGREGRVVWYDLDLPQWHPSGYIQDPPERLLSTMEVYDLEFAHRLSVIGASLVHLEDPTSPLLAEPIAVPECGGCGWQDWCFEQMEASGDVSLLPGMTIEKRFKCLARGVTTLQELASLDSRSARLIAAVVDVQHLTDTAQLADPSTPVTDLLTGRPKQAERLVAEGICTVADVARIDPLTATFGDAGLSDLPQQIDNARARIGPFPAYRRRGVDQVVVPRADIEVDVDMENVNDGCYLWGTLLNVRDPSGAVTSEYLPFVSWDPDTAAGEIDAFRSFWGWFTDLRTEAARQDASFRAYCYSQGAENGQLRRLAARCGLEKQVEDFIRSEQWVDLLPIVRDQLITGLPSMGLKTVAPLAGFSWRGDEVGGDLAMVGYLEAVAEEDPTLRSEARRWILDYNEDDVRATATLREWLHQDANLLPSIEEAAPLP
jgi:predicted RecB family nuclease